MSPSEKESIHYERTSAHAPLRAPLTALQGAMLMSAKYSGGMKEVVQVSWRLQGAYDVRKLEQAWKAVAVRHEVLRVHFNLTERSSSPYQEASGSIVIPPIQVTTPKGSNGDEAAFRAFLESERARLSDVAGTPCWGLGILKLNENESFLVWSFPHALLDGVSAGRILKDFVDHAKGTQSINQVEEHGSIVEFLERRMCANFSPAVEWWKERLKGYHRTGPLPCGAPLTESDYVTRRVMSNDWKLGAAALSARFGISMEAIVQTACSIVLMTQTGGGDNVVGLYRSCRRCENEPTGMLANIVPLRLEVDPAVTVEALLKNLHTRDEELKMREMAPMGAILDAIQHVAGGPLFSLLLVHENKDPFEAVRQKLTANESLEVFFHDSHPIVLRVKEGSVFSLELWVQKGAMSVTAADRLLEQFAHVLELLLEKFGARIGDLECLAPSDRLKTVVNFNMVEAKMEEGVCLHHGLEHFARTSPGNLAVVGPDATLTYGDLDRRANQFANYLIRQGVKPGGRIMVCLEKSSQLVVSMVAIHKCGCAYVPADPSWPLSRISGILETLEAEAFITLSTYGLGEMPTLRSFKLDQLVSEIGLEPETAPGVVVSDAEIAYIIFTSGSTGKPKGVEIPHRGVVNTMFAFNRHFKYGPSDRSFGISSHTFDPSIHDIFGLFFAGGAVVLCPPSASRDPEIWAELIEKHGVTSWCSVPQLVQMLFEFQRNRPERLASLRIVRMGGDSMPMTLPGLVWSVRPGAEIANEGGVTEVSVCTTLQPVTAIDPKWKVIPYGRPLANQKVYILDSNLNPCPTLVPGDIYFGGLGLARGYWKDPVRTESSFAIHPRWNVRLYRTGDRGRFVDTGDLEFLGREDNQVKLGGFRIELGEIETAISSLSWVREVIVVKRELAGGADALVAYVVPTAKAVFDAAQIHSVCLARLPHYMIPATSVEMESLPISANGKVDRKALPEPKLVSAEVDLNWSEGEKEIAEVWSGVLGTVPDSPERSFFECGGNSLLGLRLVEQIRRKTGFAMPLSSLFSGVASARRMAAALAEWRAKNTPETEVPLSEEVIAQLLVPIQTQGNRPPFFFLGGYLDMGNYFPKEQPYYAILISEEIRNTIPDKSFSELAATIIKVIKTVQPRGPYYISGYCFASVFVYEISRQLRENGETVAYAGMVEPAWPKSIEPPPAPRLSRLRYTIFGMLRGWFGGPVNWLRRIKATRDYRQRMENLGLQGQAALHDFKPTMLDQHIEVLLCVESMHHFAADADPRKAWAKWCKSISFTEVPGNHHTVLRDPVARQVASVVQAQINRYI